MTFSHVLKAQMDRFHVTPAIAWSMVGTVFSGISGPVVALLIAQRFTPEMQGYYYTFNGLLALSVFLELGFNTCIIQFISHEYAHLSLDDRSRLQGDSVILGRLASLARLSLSWYAAAAVLVFVGVGVGGEIFFRLNDHGGSVQWRGAWWLLCGTTALTLLTSPLSALLDGCDQIDWTTRLRIFQNLTRSCTLIALIYFGFNLYAPAMAAFCALAVLAVLFVSRWHRLFRQVLTWVSVEKVSWRKEIWPMQWRIAVSWASGYFIFSIFSPLLFASGGARVAGQFGMTWAFVMAINGVSCAFVGTRGPRFGALTAKSDWTALQKLWRICVVQSVGLCAAMCAVFIVGAMVLDHYGHPFRERLVSTGAIVPLCLATVINQVVFTIAMIARAEKREPFLWSSVVVALIVSGASYATAAKYGALGIGLSYLGGCVIGFVWALLIYRDTQMAVALDKAKT
ncbi:MAG: hypothetical protein NTV51_13005 [Verrucomicrobia bacterium]|nr:hypothetical protein [Verrucomicrobiota bacterium]